MWAKVMPSRSLHWIVGRSLVRPQFLIFPKHALIVMENYRAANCLKPLVDPGNGLTVPAKAFDVKACKLPYDCLISARIQPGNNAIQRRRIESDANE
ncbi:hypothetical protein [Aestuariispira ectoiniformans]|uniref:hypothetical protein n=1 Tax=Aestuariispira ectoiniformans TaxID=2775080 RepID=UPI00223C4A00|nr:hypothetical protein [Aestuariispira ectoiniformans]